MLTLKVSTELFGFYPYVQTVNDRKTDVVLGSHFSSVFRRIDGQCDNADVRALELLLLAGEICELQITEGSPVTPVEEHNVPFLL